MRGAIVYKLFGCKGCGSAAIEVMLELLSVPYATEMLEWGKRSDWDTLKRWNPLARVPARVAPEGPSNHGECGH